MTINLYVPSDDEVHDLMSQGMWLDHTRANAIHTCNRWGVVRYMHNKALSVEGRAVPLECGSAMHQAFAAMNLHRLAQQGFSKLGMVGQFNRIFGNLDEDHEARCDMLQKLLNADSPDSIALEALYTSGFYDDPADKRRTMSNMEVSLLHFLTRQDKEYPIFIQDNFVGIEVPTRIVIDYGDAKLLYLGRVDAVKQDGDLILPIDYKTASNVSNAWETQWQTSHQMTGYCVSLQVMLQLPVYNFAVEGLQIPLPKTNEYKGYVFARYPRSNRQFGEFFNWVRMALDIWMMFKDKPFNTVQNTNACYRYFRPCPFLPICTIGDDDPDMTLEEMVDASWNPLGDD